MLAIGIHKKGDRARTCPTRRAGAGYLHPQRAGLGRFIAVAAGLAPATVHDLASGRRQRTPATARILLNVGGGTLPRARVDVGKAGCGCGPCTSWAAVSAYPRVLDVRETTIRPTAATISAKTGLYDAWRDKRAPPNAPAPSGVPPPSRRRAIAGNWRAGASLDDVEPGTRGYRPTSDRNPASGTGVASDIHPPA